MSDGRTNRMMSVDQLAERPLGSPSEERPCLPVNLVLSAAGNSGEETASFTRLLVSLTALALERFDAAREHNCQKSLREYVSPCLARTRTHLFHESSPFCSPKWVENPARHLKLKLL